MALPRPYGGEADEGPNHDEEKLVVDSLLQHANASNTTSESRRSKLERMKRRLRDRESRLGALVKKNQRRFQCNKESQSLETGIAAIEEEEESTEEEASTSPSEDSSSKQPTKPCTSQAEGNKPGDPNPVKVLSYAAFKLQRQVDKKSEEADRLRGVICDLEATIKANEKEKAALQVDLNVYRRSVEAHSDHIDRLSRELEEKNSELSKLNIAKVAEKRNADDLKEKLAAARKDFEWVREQSVSNKEQTEYLEYELLSKNDEIDKLHVELDQNLRRVVELEVDMDLIDGRKSLATKKESDAGPYGEKVKALKASADSILEAESQNTKRSNIRRLMFCQSVHDEEALLRRSQPDYLHTDSSYAEATSVTSTTVTGTTNSQASSPARNRSSRGKKSDQTAAILEEYEDVIDNLRAELSSMEERYKQDKYNNSKLVQELKQENNEYLIKLVCMESKLKNKDPKDALLDMELLRDLEDLDFSLFESDGMSRSSNEAPRDSKASGSPPRAKPAGNNNNANGLPNKVLYLEQKIEALESERILNKRQIEDLEARCTETGRKAKAKAKADKRTIVAVACQNEAQSAKILELERRLGVGTASQGPAQVQSAEYTSNLEDKVKMQLIDITKLRREVDLKDQKIEALRAEIIKLRTTANVRTAPSSRSCTITRPPSELKSTMVEF